MSLRAFKYLRAASLDAAVSVLAGSDDKTVVMAGGTDLLGALKDDIHAAFPEVLIDISAIPGLGSIRRRQGGVVIGALTTLDTVAQDKLIARMYPLLAQAARSVASPQIRNRGTVGGNLCQEPRCWYYRHPEDHFHCLRKGGGQCGAILGDHRFHSIYGAVRPADPACAATCPGHVEIPAYLEGVRRGDLKGAARILLERNPMPAVTGRVCPHTCESECNRNDSGDALSIRAIERHVGDYALKNAAALMRAPTVKKRRRIAVVGSGPAGLGAAFYLRRMGYRVTVFDRMPEAGGMLAYGLPPSRLPQSVLRRQIQAYARMGIEFCTGAAVGEKGLTLTSLRRRFDAVFLATGAWRAKGVSLPNGRLMRSGLELLFAVRGGRSVSVAPKVLVIGGGNVALDVARAARRLGAQRVVLACLESRETMPAFAEDVEEALREGIEIMPSRGPHRVLEVDGKVRGMALVHCTSVFDKDGKFRPAFDPATVETVEAGQILFAIGQAPELGYGGRSLKTERGLISVDASTGATNLPGVFAGGDAATGPASVIEALSSGRRAAGAIDVSLGGKGLPLEESRPPLLGINPRAFDKGGRVRVPQAAPDQRTLLDEDVPTLKFPAVRQEARRCIDCGCVAVNASDLAPALIALGAVIKTTKRRLTAEEFFDARPLRTTILDRDELLVAVELPAPRACVRQGYFKFRLRNAIDFPIAGLAGVLELKGKKISRARVALGAVAPVPLRMTQVEKFLIGRAPSDETARGAGKVALRNVCILARNGHKAAIVKALLRQWLLFARGSGDSAWRR